MQKRSFLGLALGLGASLVLGAGTAVAAGPDKITLGYAVSLSGPFSPGTMTTTAPNYRLWVKDVNDSGGIYLKKYGKKVPIEVTEIDDRSNVEDAVRLVERLMTKDKMDLVLPPWGTGANLAVAPVFAKHGYPHLATTAATDHIPQLAKRWNNAFWFLGMPTEGMNSLVEVLSAARAKGEIGDKVAVVNVAHAFGAEMVSALRPALKKANFEVVYEASYPIDAKDLTTHIKSAQAQNPDTFVALSYPRGTIMLTETARVNGFKPSFFYTAVGTAFPIFKQKFGADAEGVFGIGGWDASVAGAQAYFKRHTEVIGQEPDRWASPVTYAALQMLQQAIERVGEIDRPKIIEEMRNGSFDTIIGKIKMTDNRLVEQWWVGQWQDGEYVGIGGLGKDNAGPARF
jgi:branched-chain amino acid transport system substrate-binding protein